MLQDFKVCLTPYSDHFTTLRRKGLMEVLTSSVNMEGLRNGKYICKKIMFIVSVKPN